MMKVVIVLINTHGVHNTKNIALNHGLNHMLTIAKKHVVNALNHLIKTKLLLLFVMMLKLNVLEMTQNG